jgi:HSP20 family protein
MEQLQPINSHWTFERSKAMNSSVTENVNLSHGWRVSNVAVGAVVALLVVTIGIESYALYRARHQEPHAVHQDAVITADAVQSPKNRSGTDDWLAPNSGVKGGNLSNPREQLNLLHQRMDQLFNNSLNLFPFDGSDLLTISSPNFDLREDADHYTIRADMPGTDKASIKVNIEGRLVTISGQRTALSETTSKDAMIRSERNMAEFVRTIELPGPVKVSNVDAKYDNGVLTLTLPKAGEDHSSTQVPIH